MRLMWIAIVVSILLYVYIGDTMPGFEWLNFRNAGKIFVIAAVLNLLYFFWFRTKRYRVAVDLAKEHPEDFRAVKRWMNYWVILLSVADSEALLAFCFRMGNKTLQQSLPLYGVGFLLTLSLWPRPIWASTRIADK